MASGGKSHNTVSPELRSSHHSFPMALGPGFLNLSGFREHGQPRVGAIALVQLSREL